MPIKETLDDAADEVERKADPLIKVTTGDDRFTVEDNGDGIPRDALDLIFDWNLAASTKFLHKPSRGCFGFGLKVVAAYLSALARHYGCRGDGYLRIRSRDYDFVITNVRYCDGNVKDDRFINDAPVRRGTHIEVKFPAPVLSRSSILSFLARYVLINPWITFDINGESYINVSKYNINKYAYVRYYSPEEFAEFIMRAREQHPQLQLRELLSEFALKTLPEKYSVRLEELNFDDIKSPYIQLKSLEDNSPVGLVGRKPLTKRVRQIFGDYERLKYNYKAHSSGTYEVWCFHGHDLPNAFISGVNNTLPYRNPLLYYHLYVTEKDSEKPKKYMLNEILKKCGINKDEPVLTIFHFFTPRPNFGSYVKALIGLSEEECTLIGTLIYETCKWYSGHKGQENASSIRCNRSMLLQKLVELVLEDYNKGYKLTSRHVFYKAAPQGLYPFNRRGYKVVCEALLNARLNGLIPWNAIADRSRYWIDPIPKYESINALVDDFHSIIMSRLGFNPWRTLDIYIEIWAEKDSIAEFIKPIAYKWLTVVCPSRGYASWAYVWEGVKRIKEYSYENNVILYLGDYDPTGLDIERHLQEAIEHFGVNCDVKRVAVKEDDTENLQPSPLKKTDPRLWKYSYYEKKYGNKVWEIDALDPNELFTRLDEEFKKLIDLQKWERIMEKNRLLRESAKAMIEKIIDSMPSESPDFESYTT